MRIRLIIVGFRTKVRMAGIRPISADDHLFSELVVRLIAIDEGGALYSFGTAFIFQPYLALTANM